MLRIRYSRWLGTLGLFILVFGCVSTVPPPPADAANLVIYDDALNGNWANWSWSTTTNFSDTSYVFAGNYALSARFDWAWAGLSLHSNTLVNTANYESLHFWVNGGASGGQTLSVFLADAEGGWGPGVPLAPVANTWVEVDIPLADLGGFAQVSGVVFHDTAGTGQAAFYIDDLAFSDGTGFGPTPTPTVTPPPVGNYSLTVDALSPQHTISPFIYGLNFADQTLADELDLPVNRWGGNATTRYNYLLDTGNQGSDWFFENVPRDNPNPGNLPHGSDADEFIDRNVATGTDTVMTVPLIGYAPKSRDYACGFSVSLYGAQQATDPWRPDCGNGVKTNGQYVVGNDPADTSIVIGPEFVQGWMTHLIGRYGDSDSGGVRFYNLDNEPMLWNHTHRDVHPDPAGYDELRDRTYAYAPAIKAVDPNAQIMGPVVWGWTAYFYSAIDAASGNWSNPPDRNAHGGVPLVEWYLQQMEAYEQANGQRILDYVDVHYYPQAAGVAMGAAGDQATQERRLRATRSLWDPAYVDESWIAEPVRLIPRMHEWVDNNYPGTKLAITEYNFGALDHINGAVTQAEVLGIFGRENLHLATLWAQLGNNDPWAYAFRMYRNYDGLGGRFGDVSLPTTSSDDGKLSIYAAQHAGTSTGTIIVVNKSFSNLGATLTVQGLTGSVAAERYQYSAANLGAIVRPGDVVLNNGSVQTSFPAQSITLFVVAPGGPLPTPTATPPVPTVTPPPPTPTTTPPPPTPTPGPTPTATPGPQFIDDTAVGETLTAGSLTGSYTETQADDGSSQSVTETESGGRPGARYSYLDHTWTFEVTGGQAVMLFANGWADPSTDGDQFQLAYSTNGTTFIDMVTLTAISDRGYATYTLPPATSGTLQVRVRDTDQTPGNRTLDSVVVDHLFVRSAQVGMAAPAAPGNLRGMALNDQQIGMRWDDLSTNEYGFVVERSADNASWETVLAVLEDATLFVDDGLAAGTTYYYRVAAFNAGGQSAPSNVIAVTTDGGGGDPVLFVSGVTGVGTPGSGSRWNATATVTISDAEGNGVSGATVTGAWSDGGSGKGTCTTDGAGQCSLTLSNIRSNVASVTLTVLDVSAPGYVYDPGQNSADSVIINRP